MRVKFSGLVGLASIAALALVPVRADDLPPESLVARTGWQTPERERAGFHLPPGFEIQLVASEPDIHKPMNMAFDDQGRLWVTSTVEYPFPAATGTVPRDTVKILEDIGEDGRARKITTFADGLNIPIGVLPLSPSQALVHAIPKILRLTDANGDGKADRREDLYATFGFGDTHGMTNAFTWGFDGWIYACHGFSNTSNVKAADGSSMTLNSGNTYRMKADGSHVEQWTHGQVNPFGLAFDPLGNLYSCDCHSRPIFQLLRDGYYSSFGKPNDGLGEAPEMMTHDHGSTGIAGIVYYAADHFPQEYRDTVFVGNVVTARINHDTLERHGSTYKAIAQRDFLSSDDPWFRPVDIELGPDGALYVADFYNKIIGHYEVPLSHPGRDRESGRIWRIIYRGPDGKRKPISPSKDYTKSTVEELTRDLTDPNLAVRIRSANLLVERGGQAIVDAVRSSMGPKSNPLSRVHGLWILERLNRSDDKGVATAAEDGDAQVRVHAMRVLAERRVLSRETRDLAFAGLKDRDAFVSRCAADALARHPDPSNIRPLLDLRHAVPADDTHLLYVARAALRDQLKQASVWDRLKSLKLTDRDERALADVCIAVPTAEGASFLLQYLKRHPDNAEGRIARIHHIARYGSDEAQKELLSVIRNDKATDPGAQLASIRAILQANQERGVTPSVEALQFATERTKDLIGSSKPSEVQAGIDLAGALKLASLSKTLGVLAADRKNPEARRVAALNALVAIEPKAEIGPLSGVINDASETPSMRDHAANMLARINEPESLNQLLKALPTAPEPLQRTIALGLAGSRPGGEQLLDAVKAGKASARLLQEGPVELRLAQSGVPDLKVRLNALLKGLPPVEQRLTQLLNQRRAGFASARKEPKLGAIVFEKKCGICHQIEGKGAKIGPQLEGVGIRGVDRLMEDILDPNRNVDQAFRTTSLALKDGQIVSGLVLREEGEVLILADAMGKEIRVPKDTVEEKSLSQLSPMPSNIAEQVSEEDFHNLLAYLLTQRPKDEDGAGRDPAKPKDSPRQ